MKVTVGDMACVAFSFRNSLHHWHLHLIGPEQKEVHEQIGEMYDKALDAVDYFSERAISKDEPIKNFNKVLENKVAKYFSTAEEDEYTVEEFSQDFDEIGNEFIEALGMCRESVEDENIKSDIDEMVSYWDNEINYLNKQRLKGY